MQTKHTIHLRVRYDECDPMGLVHHSNYLKYFEIARTDLYRTGGSSYREFEASGLYVVVARIDCRYRSPARYDDDLAITVEVQRITEAKIVQDYRIERGHDLLVTAEVTLAVIDPAGRPQRIPDCLRGPSPA